MPKDIDQSKNKTLNDNVGKRCRKRETCDDHIRHSDRLPYKNTIKHDTKPDKSDETFQKK